MTPALADVIAFAVMSERRTIKRALKDAGVAADDREDVAQDVTMLAVLHGQDGRLAWQHRGSLVRWLHVVAYRHGLAHVRREELRARYEGTHENEPVASSAEDRYLLREMLALAARATSPERWRVLRAWLNGVDVATIARRETLSAPGVYNRIRLAREDIRAVMAREDAAPPRFERPRFRGPTRTR